MFIYLNLIKCTDLYIHINTILDGKTAVKVLRVKVKKRYFGLFRALVYILAGISAVIISNVLVESGSAIKGLIKL